MPRLSTHDPAAPSVSAVGVSVQYNGHLALDQVTFSLKSSERVAVVGPNGAGKSTLFKVIAGVLRPTRGQVRLFGDAPERHICVAYVPQRSQVDMTFPVNVRDVVLMGRIGKLGLLRNPGRKDLALVREYLDLVGMGDLADRQIGELSGGQQQRVFIARSLVQEAEVMLMDEPLTGLDANSQEGILKILDELRQRNVTVLVATHDLNQAARCFDRVLLLNHQLIGIGSAETVFTPQRLAQAYGDQLHLVDGSSGVIAVNDTCCCGGDEEGHEHGH
jgi:manganese/iron transport system ATP-binding protein